MSLNKFQFIGNLTRDSEVRYTPNSDARAVFDLGVNQTWRDSAGQKQEKSNFFRIKCWGKTAENAGKYLGKLCTERILLPSTSSIWKRKHRAAATARQPASSF